MRILCDEPMTICNVCSVHVNEDNLGYSEENDRVRNCKGIRMKQAVWTSVQSWCEDKVCDRQISFFTGHDDR